jgi:hypothetical protein
MNALFEAKRAEQLLALAADLERAAVGQMNTAQAFLHFLLGFGQARNGANLQPPHRPQGTPERLDRRVKPLAGTIHAAMNQGGKRVHIEAPERFRPTSRSEWTLGDVLARAALRNERAAA